MRMDAAFPGQMSLEGGCPRRDTIQRHLSRMRGSAGHFDGISPAIGSELSQARNNVMP